MLSDEEADLAIRNMGPREREIVALFLQGYENREIARKLGLAMRTVKAHFNRLFLRFNIGDGGIKRVRLATLLHRRITCLEAQGYMALVPQVNGNRRSSSLSPLA